MSGTTIKRVSQIAGLSAGIVNFHFQSKKNLLDETLRFLAEEHHDRWKSQLATSGLTPAEKLLTIVDAHFDPEICNTRKLSVWFGFFGESTYRQTYRTLVGDIDEERWRISLDLCRAIRDDGGYETVDPAAVIRNLEALYDGYFLNILMYPDMFSCDDARLGVREFLARTFPDHFGSRRDAVRSGMP